MQREKYTLILDRIIRKERSARKGIRMREKKGYKQIEKGQRWRRRWQDRVEWKKRGKVILSTEITISGKRGDEN